MNPTPRDPRLGLLGLALKGRRLEVGRDRVRVALHRGRARLVVLAPDAGGALVDEMTAITEEKGVTMVEGPSRDEMGRVLGRRAVAVTAVTDKGLADALMQDSVRRQV